MTYMVLYQYDAYIGYAFFKNKTLAELKSENSEGKESIVEELDCFIPNVGYSDNEELWSALYAISEDIDAEAELEVTQGGFWYKDKMYTNIEELACYLLN